MCYIGKVYLPSSEVDVYFFGFGMFLSLLLMCSCSNEREVFDAQTPKEREAGLRKRVVDLGERWKAHEAKKKSKKAEDSSTTAEEKLEVDNASKSTLEKAIAMKDAMTKTVQDVRNKSETAVLVIDSLDLALDMEAEGLRQDFAKAKLEIVEVGNHLECSLISTDDEFVSLREQSYDIEWWYQGRKVKKKASRYCSGATLGIGLDPGPSCPHHIKGAFYPYMAINYNQTRKDDDRFQCGLSFTFSMNAAIQKHFADNPFPELKSDAASWSRWPELKKQGGRPWDFKGTELDCGKDGPQGHRCHLIEEEW